MRNCLCILSTFNFYDLCDENCKHAVKSEAQDLKHMKLNTTKDFGI